MKTSYHHELETAIRAARAAGDLLRADFHRKEGAKGSGGHAQADETAEEEIRRMLRELHPLWGYRGEETGTHESEDPDGHIWLVDPNDGTSAYLEGYRGSAVSIGLLRDGKPVLASSMRLSPLMTGAISLPGPKDAAPCDETALKLRLHLSRISRGKGT